MCQLNHIPHPLSHTFPCILLLIFLFPPQSCSDPHPSPPSPRLPIFSCPPHPSLCFLPPFLLVPYVIFYLFSSISFPLFSSSSLIFSLFSFFSLSSSLSLSSFLLFSSLTFSLSSSSWSFPMSSSLSFFLLSSSLTFYLSPYLRLIIFLFSPLILLCPLLHSSPCPHYPSSPCSLSLLSLSWFLYFILLLMLHKVPSLAPLTHTSPWPCPKLNLALPPPNYTWLYLSPLSALIPPSNQTLALSPNQCSPVPFPKPTFVQFKPHLANSIPELALSLSPHN